MDDPAAVAARNEERMIREEKLKWYYAFGGVAFVAAAVYQFVRETKNSIRPPNRPRQPWDGL
jgi:hypothetical protein